MPTIDIYNTAKEKVGEVELEDSVFGTEVKEHLFHTMVRYQMAKRRSGNHATKSRAQVSGGGRKPYRQKGTGRARAGTTRAPQWRGGGVVHGPQVRSHGHALPKKVRKAALCSALSRRCEENRLTGFNSFLLPEIKTSEFAGVMSVFGFEDLLLVLSEKDETVMRSARNIPGVKVLPVEGLNVYDILNHSNLAITATAVEKIQSRLG